MSNLFKNQSRLRPPSREKVDFRRCQPAVYGASKSSKFLGVKVKTTAVLTEKIDNERMIRQADSYYIDTNMLQNLPKFVSYIFSANALAFPSLISPLKVKKQPLDIFTVPPDVAAAAPDIKQVLDFDFDKEEKPPAPQETLPLGIAANASDELSKPAKLEKTIQLPDPQEEEWAFTPQPDPEEEKTSLLDFDF